jgi:hypothetical protein
MVSKCVNARDLSISAWPSRMDLRLRKGRCNFCIGDSIPPLIILENVGSDSRARERVYRLACACGGQLGLRNSTYIAIRLLKRPHPGYL